ncbi:MAG: phosphate ABC transporter substrate-binding protein [Sphingomonadales bacterium 32-68-7]|nr:MAG: phosphate ABC transporter substrate-binding protein [Sphingomonadales bacterium 12-68-11]OYX09303.1 MAG: phosphate ABC transporter substrate-binding protein [Sphingomonadales bacterium 32-68-7]
MRRLTTIWLASGLALALAACGGSEQPEVREGVRAVGSSTVYPFAVAVAEELKKSNPDLALATIESTGTGEGVEQFCAGSGLETPDIVNASRRMTKAEFDACRANGVTEIVEIQVGLDGIVFASARDEGVEMNLSPAIIYQAIAAKPFDRAQTAKKWSDIDPSLPGEDITVYGPPSTSGTRDALIELALHKGCASRSTFAALAESEPARYTEICGTLRSDSAYIDQGEQDEVIVRKVAGNEHALAIFGFSYVADYADRVKPLRVDGVEPTVETITNGTYPLARPLYIYVKKAHLASIPGLKPYLDQWVRSWGQGGALARIGLVPSHDDELAANAKAITDLPVMTGEGLAES